MSNELFELPESWVWTQLNLCSNLITKGESPGWQGFNYVDDGIPFIRSENVLWGQVNFSEAVKIPEAFHAKLKRSQVHANDVLINLVGASIGRCGIVPPALDNANINQAVAIIRVNSSLEAQYLLNLILSPYIQEKIHFFKVETARPNISLSDLNQLSIPLPPRNEQKRIVAKIEELRDRHQRAKQALEAIPELCDRFRQSVLAAAFRGDLTADWREENPKVESASVLLKRILSKNSFYKTKSEVDSSDLPPLADSWVWTSFEQISKTITKGSSPKWQGFEYLDSGISFVRSQNVGWGVLDLSEVAYLSESFNEHEPRSIIQVGDILLNIVGASIGRAALANSDIAGGNTNQAVAIIRLCDQEILAELAVFYLISPFAQKIIHLEKVDVARANFSLSDIKALPFPLIPLVEQRLILERIKTNFTLIQNLANLALEESDRFKILNQSILAKAFRGELVEQDPNDEPASVLLERIRAEREKADSGKKTKGKRAKQLELEV